MSLLDDVSIVVTPNGYKAGTLYGAIPVPTEGSEEVTNGDFATDSDWAFGGTSFSAGAILFDNTNDNAFQSWSDTVNTLYKLTITKTGLGKLRFRSGFAGSAATKIEIPESGIIYFTSTSDTNRIQIYGDENSINATLNSVSIKEYTSADMDVTRATAATRVDENGLVNYAEIIGGEEVTDGNFSQEGAEKVTNGDFSVDSNWNQVGSNGWSIDTGTSTLNFTNASSYVFQGISTVSGKSYKVTLDIELDSGTIVAKSFSAQNVLTVTSTGRQTLIGYFKEGDSNANFGFVASGSASGKIHSVSVKEVGADWNTGTGVTIGSNVATFTSTPSGQSVQQNAVATALPNGSLAKVSFEVLSRTEGSFGLYFSGTLVGSRSSVGVFTAYFTKGTETSFYIRALGTTSGTISNVSVIEEVRDNVPRIDYTGGGCPHILAEPQRTNLLTYSEDFSNAIYIKDSTVSVGTTNNVSPSGESNATKIDVTASGRIYANVTTGTYTTSVFIKAGTFAYFKLAGVQVDLVAETNANGTIESLGNGWFKVGVNYTGNRPFQIQAYPNGSYATHTTSGNYFIWGSQIEAGSYQTSYIPTSGSTVTRNQDIFTRDGIGSLINDSEGVLFVEMAALADDSVIEGISLSDGTAANRVVIFKWNASNTIRGRVTSGGTNTLNQNETLSDITSFNKIAIKYKLNDFAIWINGVKVFTDNSGAVPIGLNQLYFSSTGGVIGSNFYGKVKQLQVYTTALTDEQLLQLTGESGTDFYESYAEMAAALTYTIQ